MLGRNFVRFSRKPSKCEKNGTYSTESNSIFIIYLFIIKKLDRITIIIPRGKIFGLFVSQSSVLKQFVGEYFFAWSHRMTLSNWIKLKPTMTSLSFRRRRINVFFYAQYANFFYLHNPIRDIYLRRKCVTTLDGHRFRSLIYLTVGVNSWRSLFCSVYTIRIHTCLVYK